LESCKEHAECRSRNFFGTKARDIQDEVKGNSEKSGLDPSLPKRLIKLGENAKTARLVRTTELVLSPTDLTFPYAALNYCWGPSEYGTFKTGSYIGTIREGYPTRETPPDYRGCILLDEEVMLGLPLG
jgi:hypothetical protein